MNFTNYDENLYYKIQNDELLKNFFGNLTSDARRIIEYERERKYKNNNVIKPSFDELSKVISKLEAEGIVSAYSGVNTDICTKASFYENNTPYFIIFSTLKFYGTSFNAPDIEHMRTYEGTENFIKELESDYKDWSSSYRNLFKLSTIVNAHKKIEQYQKKIDKLKSKGKIINEESDLQQTIYDLQKFIKTDEEKKLKIEFFKEKSVEKATNVLLVHDMIKKLSEEYDSYLSNKKKVDSEIHELSKTIYDRAFEEIRQNSISEIDTTEIERKLFKLLVVNKLNKSPFVLNETEENDNKTELEFDTAAVDWFIKTKKESFQELFNYVFANFESSMEEITKKTLKK